MKDLIADLKNKNPDLRDAEIEGILYILLNQKSLTNSYLIRETGIAAPVLKRFLGSISYLLKEQKGAKLTLTNSGERELTKINPHPYKWSLLEYDLPVVEKKMESIRQKHDLDPERKFDQFFATAKSTVGKAKIVKDKGLVKNKNIALIGDDDLVSIALFLISPNYNKITIFDIDMNILSKIEKIAKELGAKNIETKFYDARNELPKDFKGKYDLVLIDPPYTKSGIKLFLYRAIELLRERETYIVLNFGAGIKNHVMKTKIQDTITTYMLVIEDKIDKFTRYLGAETVGSTSSVYILRKTKDTKLDQSILNEKIYTFEEDPVEKFPYVDHYVLKIKKVPTKLIHSKKQLLKLLGEFCKTHKLKVVDTKVTKFSNKGLSITYILSTSNLLVHTWPEHQALHVDLVTCSPIYRKKDLGNTWSRLLGTKYIEIKKVE